MPLRTAAATIAKGKTMTRFRIALVGAAGRMGQAIADVAVSENAEIVAKSDLGDQITSANADVLIDFISATDAESICVAGMKSSTVIHHVTTGHSVTENP